MRPLCLVFVTTVLCMPLGAAVQGPPKAPRQELPSDRHQRHVEWVKSGRQVYTIRMGGSVDGVMTRMPISYSAYKQGWQPNVAARIENVGETDVVNPWLTANGTGDWRTLKGIAAEATAGCRTEAEKARAVWEWTRHHRFHACTWDAECSDAIKAWNVYGYTLCGDDAQVLADLWKAAGLKTRRGFPVGHGVTEVFYDGGWHLLDGDEHVLCLGRDNQTIGSEAEAVRDHDLIKRTHTYGIGQGDSRQTDEFSASLYGYEGERKGDNGGHTRHQLLFTLRPGESLEWRWDHVGKEYSYGTSPEPGKPWKDGTGTLAQWGALAYDNLRNGKWVYRPPLEKTVWVKGTEAAENVGGFTPGPSPSEDLGQRENGTRGVRPAEGNKPLRVVWRIASPYVLVGAKVRCWYRLGGEGDLFRVSWSPDGKAWQKVGEDGTAGRNYQSLELDPLLSPRGKPMYQYFVQLEMQGEQCALEGIVFDSDVQMALLAMPELRLGENRLQYTDDSPGARQVKITQEWVERSEWRPPTAPVLDEPGVGGSVEGTRLVLKWQPATAPDQGIKISDYQVQVCERPDLRWVLSPNFDKLLSRTASRGKSEWEVPYGGLLNPDTTYYWRVRALDSQGVWGPWSKPGRFQCRAPGVPLNVQVKADPAQGMAELSWEANPQGRAPVAYKVYGSEEQGFTASDTEYLVYRGRGFLDTMEQYNARTEKDPGCGNVKTPANLIGKTEQTKLALPCPLKAFYRVVAVDEKGNESGASDFAALPRPFIYTQPPAATGRSFRYEPQSVYSIGYLTCNGSYNPGFWRREKLTWSLEKGPAWLTLADGVLSGTAPAAGEYDVVLKVSNNKQQEARQSFVMRVQ